MQFFKPMELRLQNYIGTTVVSQIYLIIWDKKLFDTYPLK